MESKIRRFWAICKPYKGILYFVFLLFFFHFSWKIAIDGDMEGDSMYLFGKDITPGWFFSVCKWLTASVVWFIHLFPNTQDLIYGDTWMYFPTEGNSNICIIWGCTGLKQMFIFAGIILFYWGPFWKKCWYIPLGCVILTAYNIVRIASTVWLTDGYPERFDSLHDGLLRYIYYTIVFLLWVVWEECLRKKKKNG